MPILKFKEGLHVFAAMGMSKEIRGSKGQLWEESEPELKAAVLSIESYAGCFGIRLLRLGSGPDTMHIDNFFGRALLGLSFVRQEGIVIEVLFIHIVIPV